MTDELKRYYEYFDEDMMGCKKKDAVFREYTIWHNGGIKKILEKIPEDEK